jgi:hypothetical protein
MTLFKIQEIFLPKMSESEYMIYWGEGSKLNARMKYFAICART